MAEALPLDEVLRRARRDELMPLAGLLRLRAQGMGHAALARAIEDRLRRAGGHALGNLLRRGGPPYARLVEGVAGRLGLEGVPGEPLDALEGRVVTAWLARSWAELPPDEREATWAAFSRPGEPLPDGGTTTARAQLLPGLTGVLTRPAARALQVGGAGVLGFLLRPLTPLFSVYVLHRVLAPQPALTLAAVVQVAMLRRLVTHRLTVGFVGSPSAGKDAAIRAVFGVDSGNIHPVAGSTREVGVARIPGSLAGFVVNTPGLGDVDESLTEETRQILDHIDVFIYVLNAEGGVQARELADVSACLARGRPTLVALNKIDVLRPRDLDRYVADAREKLSLAGEVTLLPCAFDPLPQLAEAPLGVDAVRRWLEAALTGLGRDPEELGGWGAGG